MIWVALSLASALCWAGLAEINRHHSINERALNFWRSCFGLALFAAFIPYMIWPENLKFYAVGVLDGLNGIVMWAVLFHLSAHKCSRVTSLYASFATGTAFLLWLAMNVEQGRVLLGSPILFLGCMLSFGLVVWGAHIIRSNDASWWAFKRVVWIGLTLGIIDVVAKLVMPVGSTVDALPIALSFCLVSFVVSTIGAGLIIRKCKRSEVVSKKILSVGFLSGLASAAGILFYLLALQQTPNPAFAGIICMTTPVWILIYHKIRGVHDPAKPVAALLIMTGAVLMILVMATVTP